MLKLDLLLKEKSFKDELGGKIMTKFVKFRTKT